MPFINSVFRPVILQIITAAYANEFLGINYKKILNATIKLFDWQNGNLVHHQC